MFTDLTVEESAIVSGGVAVAGYANSDAGFSSDNGGITYTDAVTSVIDKGSRSGFSHSRSLTVAFNSPDAPVVVGVGVSGSSLDAFINAVIV